MKRVVISEQPKDFVHLNDLVDEPIWLVKDGELRGSIIKLGVDGGIYAVAIDGAIEPETFEYKSGAIELSISKGFIPTVELEIK